MTNIKYKESAGFPAMNQMGKFEKEAKDLLAAI